jgi:hypothetical protein
MKRNLALVIVYIFFGITACAARQQFVDGASNQSSPRKVATALDHLTVLEFEEPVAQAAIGSASFQVERQDNKVFVKPLKPNASTNLFVWTTSNQQFSYELSVADMAGMDAMIHVTNSRLAPAKDDSAKLEQSASMAVTRTLRGLQTVDSGSVKAPKNGIGVRIEEVFRDKDNLFIRYTLQNRGPKPYRVPAPMLYELRTQHPAISLASLKDKQLDQRTIARLGETKQVPLPYSQDADGIGIAPGSSKQGLIAIHQSGDWPSPTVVQLVFASKVKATVVL